MILERMGVDAVIRYLAQLKRDFEMKNKKEPR